MHNEMMFKVIREISFIIIGILIASLYVINFPTQHNHFTINGEVISENLMGFCDQGKYCCFVTKDKTNNQIADIKGHEECHALVHNDWEHFCTDKDNIR